MADENYELIDGKNVMSVGYDEAKPATSCHVRWKGNCNQEDLETFWKIKNSIQVKAPVEIYDKILMFLKFCIICRIVRKFSL